MKLGAKYKKKSRSQEEQQVTPSKPLGSFKMLILQSFFEDLAQFMKAWKAAIVRGKAVSENRKLLAEYKEVQRA